MKTLILMLLAFNLIARGDASAYASNDTQDAFFFLKSQFEHAQFPKMDLLKNKKEGYCVFEYTHGNEKRYSEMPSTFALKVKEIDRGPDLPKKKMMAFIAALEIDDEAAIANSLARTTWAIREQNSLMTIAATQAGGIRNLLRQSDSQEFLKGTGRLNGWDVEFYCQYFD